MDLDVPVHRGPAGAAGCAEDGVEAVGGLGDRPLQALRDGREVPLVRADQGRVRLGGETVGKVEHAGGGGGHGSGSDPLFRLGLVH